MRSFDRFFDVYNDADGRLRAADLVAVGRAMSFLGRADPAQRGQRGPFLGIGIGFKPGAVGFDGTGLDLQHPDAGVLDFGAQALAEGRDGGLAGANPAHEPG